MLSRLFFNFDGLLVVIQKSEKQAGMNSIETSFAAYDIELLAEFIKIFEIMF